MEWGDTILSGLIGGLLGVITTTLLFSKKNKNK
jgi:hypothetical protein